MSILSALSNNELYKIDDQVYFAGNDTDTLISKLKDSGLKKLFIRHDAKLTDLDFLYNLDFLEGLSIPELPKHIDTSPIYALQKLRSLDWNNSSSKLEAKKLKNLETLAFNGDSNILLDNCNNIKEIFIRELGDFLQLPIMSSVNKLKVLGYKSINLKNIDKTFPNIDDFSLVSAKKLESIFYLKNLELKVLELEKINRKCNFGDLINCKTIEFLYLRTKIDNCEFIEYMPNLKLLFCNEIESGDLNPLFFSTLEKVYIKKISKNSTHTKKELKEKFGEWQ